LGAVVSFLLSGHLIKVKNERKLQGKQKDSQDSGPSNRVQSRKDLDDEE
jgi:hypothetical protein